MSHLDELDEYEAELELRLKKEYSAVFALFRYCVLTPGRDLPLQQGRPRVVPAASLPVLPRGRWRTSGSGTRTGRSRIIPRAEIYTSSDVTVEELRGEGDGPSLTPRRSPSGSASRSRADDDCLALARVLLAVDAGNTQTVFGLYRRRRAARALAGRDRERSAPATSSARCVGRVHRPRRSVDGIVPLLDGAGARPRVRGVRGAVGARRRCSSSGRASAPGIPIRTTTPREIGPDRIVNAVAAKERYGAPVHRRRLRHVDELRRRLAGRRVRRRRARAGDRDLDGRAVRARGAARQGRLRRAAGA